jgi:hypothetical protein
MKKSLLTIIILLLTVGYCFAEVYVLYDKETKEVKSAINKDIAVVEKGWEKAVLTGKLKDYGLTKHPQYYKFIDGSFVQDNEKISKEVNDANESIKKQKEMEKINIRAKRNACLELESEGVKFKQIKCSDFE